MKTDCVTRVRVRRLAPFLAVLTVALVIPMSSRAQTPIGYIMNTIAGNQSLGPGESGDGGPATSAQLSSPYSAVYTSGGKIYIADQANDVIRILTPDGNINLFAGTSGMAGYAGDGNVATSAYFNLPLGVAMDASGNLFISDSNNNAIREVNSAGNVASVVNGSGSAGFGGDNAPAISAYLSQPNGIARDTAGNMYIADTGNNRIRKVLPSGNIVSIAGNSFAAYAGDGGPALQAELNNPEAVAVDSAGNVYIADTYNHAIRKVTGTVITTIAGTGVAGFSGDGGPASKAKLSHPEGVAVDAAGNVYIADSFNNRIRRVGTNGVITTIGGTGVAGYGGDGLLATDALMRFPSSVALDPQGNIYIGDPQNNVIRMMAPLAGGFPTITANGVVSASAYGGFNAVAPGSWIEIYGSNLAANTRSWNNGDFTNINAPTELDGTTVTVGGQSAFVSYISPVQVNAQVPNVGTGSQPVVVGTPAGNSSPYSITVNSTEPGLLAPAALSTGGHQYIAAIFSDGVTFAGPPGAFSGIATRRANVGDNLTLYGVGFGAVSDPGAAPGKIELQDNSLSATLQIMFGQAQATVSFYGLAPLAVGLYQFNVTVPTVAASDVVPVTFTLGGTPGTQTLYTAVAN
jgi:uncharacterized protein (TIGR03437 family)